ncbi:MAG TPA: hypothetical protein VJH95_04130 [Candidatus Nanoarchaeia archaeon]|nr:hypothetical protein [Candidatus Nanoarchaeia archaeon]
MATDYLNLKESLTSELTRLNTAYQKLLIAGQGSKNQETLDKGVTSLCSMLRDKPSNEIRQEANNLLTLAANMTSTQGGNAISSGSRAVLEYASALASITRSLRELTGDKEQ